MGQQLRVGASLANGTVAQDVDSLDVFYGREAVSAVNDGFAPHEGIKVLDNLFFRFGIKRASCFVKKIDISFL